MVSFKGEASVGPADHEACLADWRASVEKAMDEWMPPASEQPPRLHGAMRHSVEAGGKRIRPILLVASCRAAGGEGDPWPAAVAVEVLHTYSLIHDDLPSMDDSSLRRGRPTCHVAFGEAAAVLAGDALQALAFDILSRGYRRDAGLGLSLVGELAAAAGSRELVGGQMDDIENEGRALRIDELDFINRRKTGALFGAVCAMGGRIGGCGEDAAGRFRELGFRIGRAFQVVDDLIDATQSDEVAGKQTGRDEGNGKATVVSLLGLDGARELALASTASARELAVELDGRNGFLPHLIDLLGRRVS